MRELCLGGKLLLIFMFPFLFLYFRLPFLKNWFISWCVRRKTREFRVLSVVRALRNGLLTSRFALVFVAVTGDLKRLCILTGKQGGKILTAHLRHLSSFGRLRNTQIFFSFILLYYTCTPSSTSPTTSLRLHLRLYLRLHPSTHLREETKTAFSYIITKINFIRNVNITQVFSRC